MNIDYKGIVVVIVVTALVVAGVFTLGYEQGRKDQRSDITTPLADNAKSKVAQSPALQSTVPNNHPGSMQFSPSTQSSFTHFRVGNRNVKSMLSDGPLVWVATSGGVLRYDTRTDDYKLFDVHNGSLLSNGVFHVSKLHNNIVVGTYGGGMSVFNTKKNTWKNYNIPDGLADQFVYDILTSRQGDVWIATWSGANRIKGGKLDDVDQWETFTKENTNGGLPNDWVYGVEEGKKGELWFATEGGLARYDKGKWSHWQHEDGLGADYEKVKDDIQYTNDPARSSQHHARQKKEQGIGNIKVGYNPNYIVSLAVDGDGVVWCGTWGGGLSKFDGEKWQTSTVKDGLPGNHIFMLKVDSQDGRLWIGTNRGLARLKADGKSFAVITKKDGLFANNVFSMAKDQQGTLWIGSFGGVARLSNLDL